MFNTWNVSIFWIVIYSFVVIYNICQWLSIAFSDSLMNFTGIPSGPGSLVRIQRFIILFLSWVVACGKLNLLFCVTDDLMGTTLGGLRYWSMIFSTKQGICGFP